MRQIRLIGDLAGRYTVERLQAEGAAPPMPVEARQRVERRVRQAIDGD